MCDDEDQQPLMKRPSGKAAQAASEDSVCRSPYFVCDTLHASWAIEYMWPDTGRSRICSLRQALPDHAQTLACGHSIAQESGDESTPKRPSGKAPKASSRNPNSLCTSSYFVCDTIQVSSAIEYMRPDTGRSHICSLRQALPDHVHRTSSGRAFLRLQM